MNPQNCMIFGKIILAHINYIQQATSKKAQLTPGKRATAVCVRRLVFAISHCCLTHPSWETPCDINAIYTSLKGAFGGHWQCGSIFIHFAVIASETREMVRNSKRIWPYSSSRSSKVIDLGVIGKPVTYRWWLWYATSY